MQSVFTSKGRLVALHGKVTAVDMIAVAESHGGALLPTGANLRVIKRGCVKRLLVSGYAWDGRDIANYRL